MTDLASDSRPRHGCSASGVRRRRSPWEISADSYRDRACVVPERRPAEPAGERNHWIGMRCRARQSKAKRSCAAANGNSSGRPSTDMRSPKSRLRGLSCPDLLRTGVRGPRSSAGSPERNVGEWKSLLRHEATADLGIWRFQASRMTGRGMGGLPPRRSGLPWRELMTLPTRRADAQIASVASSSQPAWRSGGSTAGVPPEAPISRSCPASGPPACGPERLFRANCPAHETGPARIARPERPGKTNFITNLALKMSPQLLRKYQFGYRIVQ